MEDCWSGLERVEQDFLVKNLTSKDNNYTLIAISNDENFAKRCDKILLLDEGKIVAFGDYPTVSATQEYETIFKHVI
jgi:ABC-type transport system involved in cytochrome bd biosynthesis fused ATPase/permease subunit